jgi:hypothetical protein
VVPVAEVQQMPFSFRSAAHAHQAMDGALGAYLRDERGEGSVGFGRRVRQRDAAHRRHQAPDCRAQTCAGSDAVPAGQLVADVHGARSEPITVNSDGIYEALKSGRVEAQENPLALVDLFRSMKLCLREPDQPHVVGLQPVGAPADLKRLLATSRPRSAQRDKARTPPAA